MHRDFADWYRLVDVNPSPETLRFRWKGIEACTRAKATTLSPTDIPRIALGLLPQDAQVVENFRSPFKSADATFRMGGNELELQVLAEGVLLHLMQEKDEEAVPAALGLLTANARGLGPQPPHPELIARARDFVRGWAIDVRTPQEIQVRKLNPNGSRHLASASSKAAEGELAEAFAALTEAHKAHDEAESSLSTVLASLSDTLLRENEILQEQVDVLWWVLGESSNSLHQHLGAVGMPAACLVIAMELSQLIHNPPRPSTADALCERVLRIASRKAPAKISIRKAVNATPRDWRHEWLGSRDDVDRTGALVPVLLAVRKSLATPGEDEWAPAFGAIVNFGADAQLSPQDLTAQVCDELDLLVLAGNHHD